MTEVESSRTRHHLIAVRMTGTLALYLTNCVNSQIAQSANQLFQGVYRNINANCGECAAEAGMARFVAFYRDAMAGTDGFGCDYFWCADEWRPEAACMIVVQDGGDWG